MGFSRNEDILENILGADNILPAEPQSRIEYLLRQILEEGAIGGKLNAEYDELTGTVTLSCGGNEE